MVKPGVPMEVVLNKESKRKTPFVVAIRRGERYFSEAAMQMSIRHPANAYTFFLDLIGKPFDDPIVTAYREQFPHLKLEADERRGTVNFVTDNGTLSVETLLAMVLWNAMDQVEAYAGGVAIKDAVLAIPIFFDAVERKAVETAAEIAGMNLLQLLTGGSATALNYGVFRRKEITETPQTLLIYDIGTANVVATLVQYQLVKEKDVKDPVPVVQTIGYGFDRTLGGNQITFRLRDHLVEQFSMSHNTTRNVTDDPQALAKLLKEAERVKQVLSANAYHFAQIENVMEDQDFRLKVSREELEAMFADLEPRFIEPVGDALKMAEMSIDKVDQVVLMGAGTRVPRLQQVLSEYVNGKELGRFLNTDEAAALGAVYHAAYLSKGFKVKRFDVREKEPPTEEKQSFMTWLASLSSATDQDSEKLKQRLMNAEEVAAAKKILADYSRQEKAKAERDAAFNALESAVYDYQSKLEETEFTHYGTAEELDKIREEVALLKEWLDDGPGADANADELKAKKRELDGTARKLKSRRKQKEERPKFMEKLEKALVDADAARVLFQNSSAYFTEVELGILDKAVNAVRDWYEPKKAEQAKLADNQDPAFSVSDLKDKTSNVEREVRYLFNKMYAAKLKEEAERAAERKRNETEAAAKKAAEEKLRKEQQLNVTVVGNETVTEGQEAVEPTAEPEPVEDAEAQPQSIITDEEEKIAEEAESETKKGEEAAGAESAETTTTEAPKEAETTEGAEKETKKTEL